MKIPKIAYSVLKMTFFTHGRVSIKVFVMNVHTVFTTTNIFRRNYSFLNKEIVENSNSCNKFQFFTLFDPLIDSLKFSRIQWDGPRTQDFILSFLCDIQQALMPCPFTGPKMFWAGPNFLCQTKNLFTYCGSHKHFVPDKKMICIQ